MDYKTKPTSRDELRTIAQWVRLIYDCNRERWFDVIRAFELTPLLFPQVTCTVVEDDKLPNGIMGRCKPDLNGHYLIEMKESVYNDAVEGKGGPRAHVLHEICHAILCLLGFTPVLECSFKDFELRPCESMEWQAKALCGEILIPYGETQGLSVRQIMNKCGVSQECAALRENEFRKPPSAEDLF